MSEEASNWMNFLKNCLGEKFNVATPCCILTGSSGDMKAKNWVEFCPEDSQAFWILDEFCC
jgi:hypothetical protein